MTGRRRRRTSPARAGYRLLLADLRQRRAALLRIALWSTVEALPALLSGLAVSAAIDRFLAGDVPAGLGFLGLLLAAAAVGAVATRRLFPWLAAVVEPARDTLLAAVVHGAVTAAAGGTQRLDRAGVAGGAGSAPAGAPAVAGIARLTDQVQSVRNILFGLLRSVRPIAFTFVGALAGLSVLSPAVALLTAVPVVLALTLFGLTLPALAGRHRRVLLAGEEVARRAGSAFDGIRDAVACGAQQRTADQVGEAVDAQTRASVALARAGSLRAVVAFTGGQLPLLVLLIAAPLLVRSGHLSLGEVVGAATYLMVSLEPAVRSLLGVAGGWGLDLAVTLRRLGEGFAGPMPVDPRRATAGGRYDLAVQNLTFAHGPHAAPIVAGLSLDLPEGGHLAVVGPSGIGKSTLANLIAGLLPAQAGEIRLGGVRVTDLPETQLRRVVGLIPQEAYVFAGTIRENLGYLAPAATDNDLLYAADAVGLRPVLDRLGGLDALVGPDGAELSNGEKQLVALVRMYLAPARLVILDEATSQLDPVAEARAEAAFASRPGSSLVVIAHRISSARRASTILLLDGGRAVLGTHDQLVSSSARYADLVGNWDVADLAGVGG